jgi:hypothetical protein
MIEIPLRGDLTAIIDDEDAGLLERYYFYPLKTDHSGPYVRVLPRRGVVRNTWGGYLHRIIMQAPKGIQIDHVNNDGLDNRRANLRLATGSQNRGNIGLIRTNRSGYKGVFKEGRGGKWRAAICHHGRIRRIGDFDDPREAAKAYDRAAIEQWGPFAVTNEMLGNV